MAGFSRDLRSPWTPLVLAAAAGGLALLDALVVEPRWLKVRRIDVPVESSAGSMAGLRLLHISDLHVGGVGWRREAIARAIEACDRETVDVIAITGDLIGRRRGVAPALELLSRLRKDVPRLAVLGNHDHVYGRKPLDELLDGLDALGIAVLRNRSVPLSLPSGRVWFVGVDDGYSLRDDLEAAQWGLSPDDFPRVLLTHYPEIASRIGPGQAQLILAGHTHAGQVRLPVLTHMVNTGHARSSYSDGLYLVNGNPLYVTPGVGMSGIPLRFRNRPEVALLRLVPSRPLSHRETAEPAVESTLLAASRPGIPG